MIGEVMFEGGSFKLSSPGVLDVLAVLNEALQQRVHCARAPSDVHKVAGILYLPERGLELRLNQ